MTIITDAYINALLADATYAISSEVKTEDDLFNALKTRLGRELAEFVINNFTLNFDAIIDTSEFFDSGFDATVWTGKNAYEGKTYVAMRGTDFEFQDILSDIDLAGSGVPIDQYVDMINWWLLNTTPEGEEVQLFDYGVTSTGLYGLINGEVALGKGVLSSIANSELYVTGHSLGGNLASGFTRLFGGKWNIAHTSTFNSAGFTSGSEAIFNQMYGVLGENIGLGRYPNTTEQSNYFAKNGVNFTTNSFYFEQVGARIELFNEHSELGVPNHFIERYYG